MRAGIRHRAFYHGNESLKEWIKEPKIQTKNAPTINAKLMPRQPKNIEKWKGKKSKNHKKSSLAGSGRLWAGVLGLKLASGSIFVGFCAPRGSQLGPMLEAKILSLCQKAVSRGSGKGAGGDLEGY